MKAKILLAAIGLVAVPSAFAAPNPASVFCEKLGGKTEMVTQSNGGQIGLCVFENGNVYEEWTLFRMLTGKEGAYRLLDETNH